MGPTQSDDMMAFGEGLKICKRQRHMQDKNGKESMIKIMPKVSSPAKQTQMFGGASYSLGTF